MPCTERRGADLTCQSRTGTGHSWSATFPTPFLQFYAIAGRAGADRGAMPDRPAGADCFEPARYHLVEKRHPESTQRKFVNSCNPAYRGLRGDVTMPILSALPMLRRTRACVCLHVCAVGRLEAPMRAVPRTRPRPAFSGAVGGPKADRKRARFASRRAARGRGLKCAAWGRGWAPVSLRNRSAEGPNKEI